MRPFLFLTAFFISVASEICLAGEKSDFTIESDLVEILDSFSSSENGHDPNSAPKLSDILEAKGTLVFFDNTNNSGKKPTITQSSSRSNTVSDTLERARRRLFGSRFSGRKSDTKASTAPVFSDRTRVSADDLMTPETSRQQQIMSYALDYDGEKTVVPIPPNAVIEVPFLKHIPYFFSRIEILNNGLIKVTETIERVIEPKETDFTGIDRYFPKYHVDRTGKTHKTSLTVLEAFIDDQPVSPELWPDIDGIRVSMHLPKAQTPGVHVYRITYLFFNKIAEFKNNDKSAENADFKELIWDVTGNHWNIPVTRAGAIVIFPPNSKVHSQTAVTGKEQKYTENFRIKRDKNNDLSFALTFPLAPFESLTIMTSWSEPPSTQAFQNGKLDRFIIEYGTAFIAFIAFLFILSYYLATWFGQRKNREQSPVKAAPLQKGDLTPSVLNYALNKKVSSDSLFITLLDMAAKKFLSFGEDGNGTMLLIKNTDKETGLTALEKRISALLFTKEGTSFALTDANALRLKRVMNVIEKRLLKEYRKKFTVFPHRFFWFGILMAVIAIISISSVSLFPTITGLTALSGIILLIPVTLIGEKLYTEIKNGERWNNKKKILMKALALLPFALCLTAVLIYYGIQTSSASAFFFFALLACIGIFKVVLRSPSGVGNSILENIEGYKLYLSSQDDTLLNIMRNAEAKIKSLYEKHLPFAVALGLAQPWTRRFAAFSEQENQLKPDWYKGKLPFNENFVEALKTEFDKAFPQNNTVRNGSAPSRFKKPVKK